MKAREIIKDIKGLGVYSPEQFAEYLGYFRQTDSLSTYLQQAPNTANEIERRIQSQAGATPVEPDYSLSERVARAVSLSGLRDSATFGIVSGCFDLLHLGHIRGMAYAKQYLSQYPNPLLVALTLSDANIRAKKGESRPVLNINERLDMICNVGCVDYVIPLEEPNCLSVLEELRPDYFFKANADRSQDIVRREMELVEAHDGEVVVFPPRPDSGVKSTTKMIESVVEKMMREW
jgi:bifunctional ADP-heptose synthase (sugar kinase/adenylyltransferase)